MNQIKGSTVVLVGPCTPFDPLNPSATAAHRFVYVGPEAMDKDGKLSSYWVSEGYVYVGHAAIQIDLLPQADITGRAVEALKQQKTKVLADAHAKATHIEGRIQSLLAIAN